MRSGCLIPLWNNTRSEPPRTPAPLALRYGGEHAPPQAGLAQPKASQLGRGESSVSPAAARSWGRTPEHTAPGLRRVPVLVAQKCVGACLRPRAQRHVGLRHVTNFPPQMNPLIVVGRNG